MLQCTILKCSATSVLIPSECGEAPVTLLAFTSLPRATSLTGHADTVPGTEFRAACCGLMGLLLGLLTYIGIAAGLVFGMATAVTLLFSDGGALPKQAKATAPVPPKIASFLERKNEPAPAAKPELASPPTVAMTEPTPSVASAAVIRTPGYESSAKPKRSAKAERRAPVREAQAAPEPPARSAAVAAGVSPRELGFRIP